MTRRRDREDIADALDRLERMVDQPPADIDALDAIDPAAALAAYEELVRPGPISPEVAHIHDARSYLEFVKGRRRDLARAHRDRPRHIRR